MINRTDRRSPTVAADIRGLLVRSLTCADQPDDLCATPDANELHRAADYHRIGPAVYLYLRGRTTDPELIAPLERSYRQQLARHLQTVADLKIMADALDAADVGWVLVKGPSLSAIWPRPDMREYHDLDLLVDRHRFLDALSTLENAGARLVDRNQPMILDQLRAELRIQLRHGTTLDLHWDLVNDASLRKEFRFPTEAMLERHTSAVIGGVAIPVLDPTDTLLHLGYHTTLSGAHRLLWFMDIDSVLSRSPDWAQIEARAGSYGVTLPLLLALDRATRILGTPVPHHSTRRFRAWRFVAHTADRVQPVPWVPGATGSSRALYQNVRSSARASLLPALRDALRRSNPDRDDAWRNPLHQDIPDHHAWTRYISLVQGEHKP
jgi:hypothetical protein